MKRKTCITFHIGTDCIILSLVLSIRNKTHKHIKSHECSWDFYVDMMCVLWCKSSNWLKQKDFHGLCLVQCNNISHWKCLRKDMHGVVFVN